MCYDKLIGHIIIFLNPAFYSSTHGIDASQYLRNETRMRSKKRCVASGITTERNRGLFIDGAFGDPLESKPESA